MIHSAAPLVLAVVGFFGVMASAVPVVNTAQGATKYFWRTPQGLNGDVILTAVRDGNGNNVINEQRYFWGIPFDHKQYFNESLYVPGYTPNQNAPGNVWSQDGAPRLRRQYDAAGSQQLFYLRNGLYDNQCVEVESTLGSTIVQADAQCSDHETNAVDWFPQPLAGQDQYVIGYINKNNDGSVASAACMSNTGTAASLVQIDMTRYANSLQNGTFPCDICNMYTGVDLAYF